ncbi:DUF4224 domain-containing protein [Glaciimonas sp. Gout2]|uniref:DUF4224 domain-containing protein n=1 Tax=Glaciimonas sp. Gout2 TaxID=3048625 RepID=UPI002B233CB6|nr:hypothetical protein [Glaciimonas sp. Gout2]
MNTYLTTTQLAALIDCSPTSYTCMKKWLDNNGWPYAVGRIGYPKVSLAYHDARLSGAANPVLEVEFEPNFGAL